MAFVDRLSDPQINKWFALFIEGIPRVLTSMEMPTAFYSGGRSEIVALDVSGGISPPAQTLNRKAGVATPTSMSFRIGPDDKDGTLRKLFAVNLASRAQTHTISTLDWTDTAELGVLDVSAFDAAGGDIYVGRETIGYDHTDPAEEFHVLTRGKYDSVPWRFVADGDYAFGTRYVSDHPLQWDGREVKLHMGICNAAGQPLDTAFGGPDSKVVWRGLINGINPNPDWASWQLSCQSIDRCIDTEIGGYQGKGKLAWTSSANPLPWNEWQNGSVYLATAAPLEFELNDIGAGSWTDLSTVIASGSHGNLLNDVVTALQLALDTAYPASTNIVYETVNPNYESDATVFPFNIFAWTDYANFGGFRSNISAGSAWRWLGLKAGLAMWNIDFGGSSIGWGVSDMEALPLLLIPKTANKILIREDIDDSGTGWPSDGHAILKAGDHSEIIYYGSIDVIAADAPRILRLENIVRGAIGTEAREIRIEAEQFADGDILLAHAEDVGTIKSCVAFEDESVLSIFLKLCMSTGSTGLRDATYDVATIGDYVAAGLDVSRFDTDQFETVSAQLGSNLVNRTVAFAEPLKIKEWIGNECAALGLQILARQTPTGYQVTVDRVQLPGIIGGVQIGADDIHLTDWPTIESQSTQLINRLEFQGLWSNTEEKFLQHKIIFNNQNSQVDTGQTQSGKLEIKGVKGSVDDLIAYSLLLAPRFMAHFGKRYSVVQMDVKKTAWTFRVGDEVLVTLAGAPNDDGTSGWVDEPMLLLAVAPTYAGAGNSAAARLTLLKTDPQRLSYYVPTATVATTPAADTITVNANDYTDGTSDNPITQHSPAKDIDQFEAGMTVYFRTPGDEATNESTSVIQSVNRATNTIVFTGAYAGFIAAGDVICYPGWASADTTQKKYVYIADITGPTIGAAGEPPFLYGA